MDRQFSNGYACYFIVSAICGSLLCVPLLTQLACGVREIPKWNCTHTMGARSPRRSRAGIAQSGSRDRKRLER